MSLSEKSVSSARPNSSIMTPVLHRPRSRLPKKLRRPVSAPLRAFVRRRHQRTSARKVERWKRSARRVGKAGTDMLRMIRRWGLLVTLLTLAGLFTFLAVSPVVQVREIRVQRSEARVDIERVQKSLSPLFGRHLLFLPEFEVLELLRASIPDLQEVQVSKSYPSELVVRVQLHPILARLTIEAPSDVPAGSGAVTAGGRPLNDYLTDNGIYVSSPLMLSGSTAFTIRDWTLRPVPGTSLLSEETLKFLRDSEGALQQEFAMRVTRRSVYLRAQEVHMQVGKTSLWFDTRSPLAPQLERLRTFLAAVGWNGAGQYVDLRLSGRVIYR